MQRGDSSQSKFHALMLFIRSLPASVHCTSHIPTSLSHPLLLSVHSLSLKIAKEQASAPLLKSTSQIDIARLWRAFSEFSKFSRPWTDYENVQPRSLPALSRCPGETAHEDDFVDLKPSAWQTNANKCKEEKSETLSFFFLSCAKELTPRSISGNVCNQAIHTCRGEANPSISKLPSELALASCCLFASVL